MNGNTYGLFLLAAYAAGMLGLLVICGVLADIVLPRCGRVRRFFERLFSVELEAECEKEGRQHGKKEWTRV